VGALGDTGALVGGTPLVGATEPTVRLGTADLVGVVLTGALVGGAVVGAGVVRGAVVGLAVERVGVEVRTAVRRGAVVLGAVVVMDRTGVTGFGRTYAKTHRVTTKMTASAAVDGRTGSFISRRPWAGRCPGRR
jgi:hypothetical protein